MPLNIPEKQTGDQLAASEFNEVVDYINTLDTELDNAEAAIQGKQDANSALDNVSGINTGDETTSTIQSKRPLKTINGESLEGTGNIVTGGGGGSTSWGNISGNISNQTDLQAELDSKQDSGDLAQVALSGDYDDLVNKPIIPGSTTLNNTLTSTATDEAATANVAKVLNDKIEAAIIGAGASASPITKNDWDGVVTTWDTGNTIQDGHQLFAVNVFLVEGEDYTVSGSTITYTDAPLASEVHTFFPNVVVAGGGSGSNAWGDLTGVPTPVQNLAGTNTGDETGIGIVNKIDTALGSEDWKAGASAEITDITSYSTVADLPVVTGSETDTYAYVNANTSDWDLNGLYAIVNGAWKHIYHYEDYYHIPIKIKQRNEIDLNSPDIIDGYTFDSSGAQVSNASKYITNYIPVRPGEYLRKTSNDTYALYDVDKVLIPTTDPAYGGGNTATDDIKIPNTASRVYYVRWVSDISSKNTADGILRQMFSQSTGDVTGWWDYNVSVERDNDKYTYEKDGVVFKNYNTNIYDPLKADYTERMNNTGAAWSGGTGSGLIPCKPQDIYSSTQGSGGMVAFYDSEGGFVSGQTSAEEFSIPSGCYYFSVGGTLSDDFFNIQITKDRVTYNEYDECSTYALAPKVPFTKTIALIGDSISSESEGHASETAMGSLSSRLLKLRNVGNVSKSGKSFATFAQDINSGFFNMPFADIYFIFLGTNDYAFANRTITAFKADMATVEASLLAINPNAKINFITPIKRQDIYDENSNGFTLEEFIDEIRIFANENGHDYLDLFNECGINPFLPSFRTDWFISGDGLHPNNDAQKVFLMPEIARYINEKLN